MDSTVYGTSSESFVVTKFFFTLKGKAAGKTKNKRAVVARDSDSDESRPVKGSGSEPEEGEHCTDVIHMLVYLLVLLFMSIYLLAFCYIINLIYS